MKKQTDEPDSVPTPRVFVSSTFHDNEERRKRVLDAIRRADMQPVAMETWTAEERTAKLASIDYVSGSDVFVGILAWRYGWIPPDETKSITELEFEAADGIDRLMFVIKPGKNVNPATDFDDGEDKYKKQEQLQAFKSRIEEMATPFEEDDLAVKVFQAVANWRERKKQSKASKTKPIKPPTDSNDPDRLAVYLDRLANLHDSLALAGFETRVRVPLKLRDLYVPLRAMINLRGDAGGFGSGEQADEKLRGREAQEDISLVRAFEHVETGDGDRPHRGIVILGDPGSGKTTHMRRLVLWMIRGEGPGGLSLPDGMVPVFLPLRALLESDKSLRDFAVRMLVDEDFDNDDRFAKDLWARGNLLVLVDGLDEVPELRRGEVREWIEKASTKRRDSVFVVTCRYAGYRDDARLDVNFLELHLRPLTNEDAEAFIHNWYRIVETTFAQDPERAVMQARKSSADLIERLRRGR